MAERDEACWACSQPPECGSSADPCVCECHPSQGSESYTELARLRSAADPERDARRKAYQEQQRRRAARALDRCIDMIEGERYGPRMVASERFVEAVGDYVLSRLHHSGDYGATADVPKGWLNEHVERHVSEGPVEGCTFCPTGPR